MNAYTSLDALIYIDDLSRHTNAVKIASSNFVKICNYYDLRFVRIGETADGNFCVVYKIKRKMKKSFWNFLFSGLEDELYFEIYDDGSCILLLHHNFRTIEMKEYESFDECKIMEFIEKYI